jgi:predicted Zn-dependent protease
VDGEGVIAQKTPLVKKGKLLGFLMSRTPRKGFLHSTGHGRAGPTGARAQFSNLIVKAGRGIPNKQLRKRLLREAKAAGEDYAVVVRLLDDRAITGSYAGGSGAAMFLGMARQGPAALPSPMVAVKLTPDGKEEYLRGLSLEGLTVRSLKQIVAVGRDEVVDNRVNAASGLEAAAVFAGGGGGAAVGTFPTTLVTPSLLLSEVELGAAKGPKAKPPVFPRP